MASIKAQGLLEPVVVGPALLDDGRHPLIAGWRRLAACAAAGQDTIEVHERGDLTDERAALRAALAENVARQDMTPTAEAHAGHQAPKPRVRRPLNRRHRPKPPETSSPGSEAQQVLETDLDVDRDKLAIALCHDNDTALAGLNDRFGRHQ